MITGTAPPSTDHAAPATFEAAPSTGTRSRRRSPRRCRAARAAGDRRRRLEHLLARRPRARGRSGRRARPPRATDRRRSARRRPSSRAPRARRTGRRTRATATARAAFVTEYAMFVDDGRLPDDEDTFTIRPQPRSAIAGATARISRIGAITCSSHCACHSSSVSSSSGRTALVPALLTSASIRPNRSRHAVSARSPASSAVTSSASGSPRRPPQARARDVGQTPPSAVRPAAPRRPRSRAKRRPPYRSRPMAPVTMQARSRRPRSIRG